MEDFLQVDASFQSPLTSLAVQKVSIRTTTTILQSSSGKNCIVRWIAARWHPAGKLTWFIGLRRFLRAAACYPHRRARFSDLVVKDSHLWSFAGPFQTPVG